MRVADGDRRSDVRRRVLVGVVVVCGLMVSACAARDAEPSSANPERTPFGLEAVQVCPEESLSGGFGREPGDDLVSLDEENYGGAGIGRWVDEVPGVAEVRIPSTVDGYEQAAMWVPHDRDEPRPLLVVLRSWGVDYTQHLGIPYARWAQENGWAMIHPDLRGVVDAPEAAGSDCAIEDVFDAIDYAFDQAKIDARQVYVVGFSAGGMTALVLAGRHPERLAGVVAWVPIYDLALWHSYAPDWVYAGEIEDACGGHPVDDSEAVAECSHRSPSAHLDRARRVGLPMLIGVGGLDGIVPPHHGVRVFNALASPADRFSVDEVAGVAYDEFPDHLRGVIEAETFFGEGDPEVTFARRSGGVTLVVYEAGHVGVPDAATAWLANAAG